MPYIGNPAVDRFTATKAASVYSGDGSTVAFTLENSVGADEDILVSVDGVVQEPSVAYAVSSGTTLTFTAAPSSNSGNNIFVYYLFTTIGTVAHPATSALSATSGTFSSNATVAGTLGVTGETTLATHLNLGDGDIIKLGASADLQIQHNASNSIIADSGTGQLQLWSNGFRVKNAAGDESIINGDENGAVTLLHNNVAKFETAATGVNITGFSTDSAPVLAVLHAAAVTVTDNSVTVIPMTTAATDTHSLYDATNDLLKITAAFNGMYFLIRWQVTITGPGDNMAAHLYQNDSVIQDDRRFYTGDEGESISMGGVWIGTVSTNDTFRVFGFSDKASGNSVSVAGIRLSFLYATKLH